MPSKACGRCGDANIDRLMARGVEEMDAQGYNAAVDMDLKDVASDIIRVTRIVWRSDSMMLLVRDRESALAVPIEISLGNIEEFNRK